MAASDFTSAGRVVSMFDPDEIAAGGSLAGIEIDTIGWRWLHVTISQLQLAAPSRSSQRPLPAARSPPSRELRSPSRLRTTTPCFMASSTLSSRAGSSR